jgi:hypothetical protein
MSFKHVVKIFEERKEKLMDLVGAEDVATDSKLRLQGAIDEIDFLLETLRHQMKESGAEPEAIFSRSFASKKEEALRPVVEQELMAEESQLKEEQKIIGQQAAMQEFRAVQSEGDASQNSKSNISKDAQLLSVAAAKQAPIAGQDSQDASRFVQSMLHNVKKVEEDGRHAAESAAKTAAKIRAKR